LYPSPVQIGAGAVVAAGAALAPDVDHPGSTVARSLGPVTRVAARVVSWVSDAVRDGTCGCCATDGTHGHRTLTHTAVFALAAGAGICAAGWRWGLPAAAVVVGVAAGLAVLGLLPRARRGDRAGRWLVGALTGVAAWWTLTALGDPGVGWWWVGVPAGVGVLAHVAGDCATRAGCPAWWPLRIRGCRWVSGRATPVAAVPDGRGGGVCGVGAAGGRGWLRWLGTADRVTGSDTAYRVWVDAIVYLG
jgi:membrane-bound metal-dependent hydrolase YbcI (DUF457 family)